MLDPEAPAPPGRIRVAWLTAQSPDRSAGGGHNRQARLIDALSSVADVHLVVGGAVLDARVRSVVAELTELGLVDSIPEQPKWRRRFADMGMALLGDLPREVAMHAASCAAIDELVPQVEAGSDVVIVDGMGVSPLVARRGKCPWWLDIHNLGSRMSAQQAALMRGRRRWLFERDASKAAMHERRMAVHYDRVIVVSREDLAALEAENAVVVPNGVDTNQFQPSPLPSDPTVVFTGALYTGPNQDAVRWLLDELWPRMRARIPSVELTLVGSRPPSWMLERAAAEGVALHADVEDVAPFLARARVAIVPLRIGSGTRLKALEALAAGRPVVGTTIGLEGLDVRAGEEVAIRDDVEPFVAEVIRLLTDDAAATQRAVAGRRAAERSDWQEVGRSFCEHILRDSLAFRSRAGESRRRDGEQ